MKGASFLKSGPAGTIFPLSALQGSRLWQLVAPLMPVNPRKAARLAASMESTNRRRRLAALFRDADNNRRVERVAIVAATTFYRNKGWNVTSVEPQNLGFDLICRKGDIELHVEVKGRSGDKPHFILTAGEYSRAAADASYEPAMNFVSSCQPAQTRKSNDSLLAKCSDCLISRHWRSRQN